MASPPEEFRNPDSNGCGLCRISRRDNPVSHGGGSRAELQRLGKAVSSRWRRNGLLSLAPWSPTSGCRYSGPSSLI